MNYKLFWLAVIPWAACATTGVPPTVTSLTAAFSDAGTNSVVLNWTDQPCDLLAVERWQPSNMRQATINPVGSNKLTLGKYEDKAPVLTEDSYYRITCIYQTNGVQSGASYGTNVTITAGCMSLAVQLQSALTLMKADITNSTPALADLFGYANLITMNQAQIKTCGITLAPPPPIPPYFVNNEAKPVQDPVDSSGCACFSHFDPRIEVPAKGLKSVVSYRFYCTCPDAKLNSTGMRWDVSS